MRRRKLRSGVYCQGSLKQKDVKQGPRARVYIYIYTYIYISATKCRVSVLQSRWCIYFPFAIRVHTGAQLSRVWSPGRLKFVGWRLMFTKMIISSPARVRKHQIPLIVTDHSRISAPSMDLASFYLSDAWNIEVAPRFLANLCIPAIKK